MKHFMMSFDNLGLLLSLTKKVLLYEFINECMIKERSFLVVQ